MADEPTPIEVTETPNDFLTMNICGGERWEILCPFLSEEIPKEPFPKVNTTEIKN